MTKYFSLLSLVVYLSAMNAIMGQNSFVNEIKNLNPNSGSSQLAMTLLERPSGSMLYLFDFEGNDQVSLIALKEDGSIDFSRKIKIGEYNWLAPAYFKGRGDYFLYNLAGAILGDNHLGALTVVNLEEDVLWAKRVCNKNIILHAAGFFQMKNYLAPFI